MIEKLKNLVAWFQRNERHLSTPIFIVGFINDVFTLGLVPLSAAIILFGVYSILAAVATIGSHYLYVRSDSENSFLKALRVFLALAAQFFTGGLLSGCLIFYTKNAALSASWPFVLLLIVVFIGNEFFRLYREELAFRVLLFFFTLYAYVLFALPTFLGTLGSQTFIESTGVAAAVFVVFLIGLAASGWERFRGSVREIIVGTVLIATLVNVSYFTGIIPPLPLSLQDAGVYHSVVHTDTSYVVTEEPTAHPWWDVFTILPAQVNLVEGAPLYVYSAVFAPIAFSTPIIHRWEVYNQPSHKWLTKAEIAFSIEGGRDGGYRGYSQLSNIVPGKYRVSIETLSGQVIGRVYFNVSFVGNEPVTQTETK